MRSFFSMWIGEVAMKVWMRPGIRVLQGLAGTADVVVVGARQAADGAVLDDAGDRLHRLEVAVAGGREAGLDHVHAQRSSCRAMRIFSSRVMDAPGLCSPSRSVVSNMIKRSFMLFS